MDPAVARVLIAQFLVGLVLAAVFWSVLGQVAGYSAAAGGLICVIPNAFLALRLVAPRRDPGAGALVNAAWIGEMGKLALTILLFTVAFTQVKPLSAAALFAGFITTQLTVLSGLLMRHERDTSNGNGS